MSKDVVCACCGFVYMNQFHSEQDCFLSILKSTMMATSTAATNGDALRKEIIDAFRKRKEAEKEAAEMRRTRLLCLLCNVVIESKSNDDLQTCECGECIVDGGPQSGRFGGHPNNYFQMPFDDEARNAAWDSKYKRLWLANMAKQEEEMDVARQQDEDDKQASLPEMQRI